MTDVMTLSEAIRLGAKMRPTQAFDTLFDPITQGSCALGAAAEAVGLLDTSQFNRYLPGSPPEEWRWIRDHTSRCPLCRTNDADVQAIIVHLNNVHRWTRERIANWVDDRERAKDAVLAPAKKATT